MDETEDNNENIHKIEELNAYKDNEELLYTELFFIRKD